MVLLLTMVTSSVTMVTSTPVHFIPCSTERLSLRQWGYVAG